MVYGFIGILRDNPFEPDEMICDLEHYLRMRDFMKMGKRCDDLRVSTANATARGTDSCARGDLFFSALWSCVWRSIGAE